MFRDKISLVSHKNMLVVPRVGFVGGKPGNFPVTGSWLPPTGLKFVFPGGKSLFPLTGQDKPKFKRLQYAANTIFDLHMLEAKKLEP